MNRVDSIPRLLVNPETPISIRPKTAQATL